MTNWQNIGIEANMKLDTEVSKHITNYPVDGKNQYGSAWFCKTYSNAIELVSDGEQQFILMWLPEENRFELEAGFDGYIDPNSKTDFTIDEAVEFINGFLLSQSNITEAANNVQGGIIQHQMASAIANSMLD